MTRECASFPLDGRRGFTPPSFFLEKKKEGEIPPACTVLLFEELRHITFPFFSFEDKGGEMLISASFHFLWVGAPAPLLTLPLPAVVNEEEVLRAVLLPRLKARCLGSFPLPPFLLIKEKESCPSLFLTRSSSCVSSFLSSFPLVRLRGSRRSIVLLRTGTLISFFSPAVLILRTPRDRRER